MKFPTSSLAAPISARPETTAPSSADGTDAPGRVKRTLQTIAFVLCFYICGLMIPVFLLGCIFVLFAYAVFTELRDELLGRPLCSLDEMDLREMARRVITGQ